MDNTPFNAEESEWSTAQPRVWTFHYLFSREYVESVLARHGLEYHFKSLPPETPKQRFIKLVKIEQYTHRMRVHLWECVEGSESTLPESYMWTDLSCHGMGDRYIWQYDFALHPWIGLPAWYMRMALGWKKKEKMQSFYRCLKWEIKSLSSEEILFEVPLDVAHLGEKWGSWDDVQIGDRQIFWTDEDAHGLSRGWECKSVKDNEIEWWWWLSLQTFDPTGIVIQTPDEEL